MSECKSCNSGKYYLEEHDSTCYDCSSVNNVFTPTPAYNGGVVGGRCYSDYTSTKNSNITPGLMSGLYRPNGPLNLSCNCCSNTMVTGVKVTQKTIITITVQYTDPEKNTSIDLEAGKMYIFDYIEDGKLLRVSGRLSDIYKTYDCNNNVLFKLKVDCSANYVTKTAVFKTDQIRGVTEYSVYADQDPTIDNSMHRYGTTTAEVIKNAVVKNAIADKNGNILEGTIVSGEVTGHTLDGLAKGKNNIGMELTVINGDTINGAIIEGKILNANLRAGSVDGKTDEKTGIVSDATITGTITNVIAINTIIKGGRTEKGTIINPVLKDSVVYGATVTGDNMITTGGITVGDITVGGTAVGGTATGGTATGCIDGKSYTIEDGTTTGKITTTGGTLVGGTIIGGTKVGRTIVNAVIQGGVYTNGTTTGGDTKDGTIIAGRSDVTPIGRNVGRGNTSKPKVIRQFDVPVEGHENQCPGCLDDNVLFKNGLILYADKHFNSFGTNMSENWEEKAGVTHE